MKAAVTLKSGDPQVIKVQEIDKPVLKEGWVRIQVKAFGLNRSEIYTRQGHSPDVIFPRIQGIECVGVVEEDPSGEFETGEQVAAIMGGMGRDFDGSYAQYTLLPKNIVIPFKSVLPWKVLGAIPEMLQTVSGSLDEALEVRKGEILLIRGGASSIGILACQLAKHKGLTVVSTTRNKKKEAFLKSNGADHVVLDHGDVHKEVRKIYPFGVDKVLELIGTRTLKDSLQCVASKGVVCMTGILGNEWTMNAFTPMGDIPSLGKLTVYMSDEGSLDQDLLQNFIKAVEEGFIKLNIDKIFQLDQIVSAHHYMESNQAKGKIVIEV